MDISEQLTNLGFEFTANDQGRIVYVEWFGEHADRAMSSLPVLDGVLDLTVGAADITDQGLQHLDKFPDLEELTLFECPVTPEMLKCVSEQRNLRRLEIRFAGNEINDGVKHICSMSKLAHLEIDRTPLRDSAIVGLGRLTQLKWLRLPETEVADGLARELPALEQLETVSLVSTNVSDATVSAIVGHRRLESVDLRDTKVTRSCLADLASLPQLTNLFLTLPPGGSLEPLKLMPSLAYLIFRNSTFSEEDIALIAELKQLRAIEFENCFAPQGSVRSLKSALPDAGSDLTERELKVLSRQ